MGEATIQNQFVRTLPITDPVTGDNGPGFFTTEDIDLAELRAVLVNPAAPPGTPSVTWDLVFSSSRDDATPTFVLSSSQVTTDDTGGDSVTSFAVGTIPGGSHVWLELGTVTTGGDAPLLFEMTLVGLAR